MRYLLIALAFATVPAVCCGQDQPLDTVEEKLQGRWEIVAGTNQGRRLAAAEVEGTYMTVINNSITTYDADNQERYRAVFTADEEQRPTEITMRAVPKAARLVEQPPSEQSAVEKERLPAVAAGILKFEGRDRCTLCYALPGEERPTEFASPQDSKIMLFKLHRREVEPVPGVTKVTPAR